MFGDDILEVQRKVVAEKEANKAKEDAEAYKLSLEQAKAYLIKAKEDLTNRALNGSSLFVKYPGVFNQKFYDILTELGWEEGIDVKYCKEEYSNELGKYILAVKNFTNQDSLSKLLGRWIEDINPVGISYLEKEYTYSIRIANGENMLDIKDELALTIVKKSERQLSFLALVNAAYRNGLEGELPIYFGVSEIEPTYRDVICENATTKLAFNDSLLKSMDNQMHISHNRYKNNTDGKVAKFSK